MGSQTIKQRIQKTQRLSFINKSSNEKFVAFSFFNLKSVEMPNAQL